LIRRPIYKDTTLLFYVNYVFFLQIYLSFLDLFESL
jgi:hypothetical protein